MQASADMLRPQQEHGQQPKKEQVHVLPPVPMQENYLLLVANGCVESVSLCGGRGGAICRYSMVVGKDWKHIWGLAGGLSQEGHPGESSSAVTLNFPFHAAFKGTSPYGWPRMAFCIYRRDWQETTCQREIRIFLAGASCRLGRQIVAGYAHTAIPLQPGRHERRLPIYTIVEASMYQRFLAWLKAQRAEFIDLHTAAKNQGREGTSSTIHHARAFALVSPTGGTSGSTQQRAHQRRSVPWRKMSHQGDKDLVRLQLLHVSACVIKPDAAVVRVESIGEMSVAFEVLLRGADALGYSF